ncbi:MAG: methyltransferase family protein [Promethearchaeota archaeon]
MKQTSKMSFLFFIASILSVLAFPYNPLIIFKVIEPNNIKELLYVGWIFIAASLTLIFLSYYSIFFRKLNVLIDSGIYAIVRHPMYLGWILGIFVATIFLYQHWIFVVIGIPGIASLYLISRQEEQRNIGRFGDDYKHYMQKVPRMNLVVGIIRQVRRRI